MADRSFCVNGRTVEFFDGQGWNRCDDDTCPDPVRIEISRRIHNIPQCDGFEGPNGVTYRWHGIAVTVTTDPVSLLRAFVLPVLAGLALGVAIAYAVMRLLGSGGSAADPRCGVLKDWVEAHRFDASGRESVTCEYRPLN